MWKAARSLGRLIMPKNIFYNFLNTCRFQVFNITPFMIILAVSLIIFIRTI
jgi:hypothetical protein